MDQPHPERIRAFGPFRLSLEGQSLFSGDRRLQLGSRAFEVLVALTEQPGQLVSKDDLLLRVWPGIHVADAALRVHIAELRRTLGQDANGSAYIVNVAGRGYRFTAPLIGLDDTADAQPSSLPSAGVRIIGRDAAIQALAQNLPLRRFVTITGSGGIGKTTVALAVAARLAPGYRHGAHFVDLTSVSDPALVPAKVASTLQLQVLSRNAIADLVTFLRERTVLLVLDNCEHLVEATALLAEQVLAAAPGVQILATSQEPMRATGEWVHRLPPLELPSRAPTDAAALRGSPAVMLFLERAAAANDLWAPDEADLAGIADICHRLDGIPLAIEFAAARVDLLGVQDLSARLDESFALLTGGRRTALPRHRTLQATLDWSYRLLPRHEQLLLCRLSIFRAGFTVAAAVAVADDPAGGTGLLDGIANLVAKSLVSADPAPPVAQHRLLGTTRAYAAQRLVESGDSPAVRRRHGEYFHALLEGAEHDWAEKPDWQWIDTYSHTMADVRAALDWAFATGGDTGLGIALTASSSPLWFRLGLMEEYAGWAERALAAFEAAAPDPATEMRLNTWFAAATFNTAGPTPAVTAAYRRALDLATELGLPEYQLHALWGLGREHAVYGDYETMLAVCLRFGAIADASHSVEARLIRDRIMSLALHLVGRPAEAQPFAERALRHSALPARSINKAFHQYSQHLGARLHLPRILWLRGFADRAALLVAEGVEQALSPQYSPALCYMLVFTACPLAFWCGDKAAAQRYVDLLLEQTAGQPAGYWKLWSRCFSAVAELGPDDGSPGFQAAAAAIGAMASGPVCNDTLATIREELAGADSISRALRGPASWCTPEILRAHGLAQARQDGADPRRTEALLLRALALATAQGALSWQLRAATSLARRYLGEGRAADARDILGPVYDAFSEGFGTADLIDAAVLLQSF